MWDEYLIASSVADALQMLAELDGKGRIVAGGTDLVLNVRRDRRGRFAARAVVDITRIPGLDVIAERGGYVLIGAAATHAQVAADPLVRDRAGVLAQACAAVGSPQIRNVGTLVGNVINALPAADGAVALFALDAEAQVATLAGSVWRPIADLYAGVARSTVDPRLQMVTALRFHPLPPGAGCAFERLSRRRALALPMVVVAVVVEVRDGSFAQVRIALGPVAPTPIRAADAERYLIGRPVGAVAIANAAKLAAQIARPRDSLLRGSAKYRTAMVETLVRRALEKASSEGSVWQR